MKPRQIFLSVFTLAISSTFLMGRPLQIIHTNDLHSQLFHATDPDRGGYLAIKTIIERLKKNAAADGIDSIVLNAGDFSEGSQYYLADHGRAIYRALKALGMDAVTLGNHDWLMGPKSLDAILRSSDVSLPLVGANIRFPRKYTALSRAIQPYISIRKAGLSIAVLGLTTDSFLYEWRNEGGSIDSPIHSANQLLPRLKKRHDLVIALTHIGLKADQRLASSTYGIDVIVGGHSHTVMSQPAIVSNWLGQSVPIVQAGQHGEWVGRLLLDVEPGQAARVIDYGLIPVLQKDVAYDKEVSLSLADARRQLNEEYGDRWLSDPIAQSEVPLDTSPNRFTVWGAIVAQTLREAANAEIGISMPSYYGLSQPAGPITREQLFVLYPRMFDLENRFGYTVWKTKTLGLFIKTALERVMATDYALHVDGMSFDVVEKDGKRSIKNLRVAGKPFQWWKSYSIAFPEGFLRAALTITQALEAIFPGSKDTGQSLWLALAEKVQRMKVISGAHARQLQLDSTFVPGSIDF